MKNLLMASCMMLLNALPSMVRGQCNPTTDSLALVALYNATNGAGWTNNTNWLVPGQAIGTWHGVMVNGLGCVQTLDLSNNLLSGSIPQELGNLSSIFVLALNDNQLTGCIPQALQSLCPQLSSGDISNNPDLDTQSWTAFCSTQEGMCCHPDYDALMALYNSTNGAGWLLSGTHADSASTTAGWGKDCDPCHWYGVGCNGSGRVDSINLSCNNLNGSIPTEIGDLIFLEKLYLEGFGSYHVLPCVLINIDCPASNSLSGDIPSSIINLTNLTELSLNGNWNTLPPELGLLTNLNSLRIFGAQGGNLNWVESLTNLQYLVALGCNLTGELPNFIFNLPNLKYIDLSGNPQLGGPLPTSASATGLQGLYLANCGLEGNLPSWLGSLPNLSLLVLSSNNFSGTIPDELGNLSNPNFTLRLDTNQLEGCIPVTLQNLCDGFCSDISGNPLLTNQNWFSFCNNNEGICTCTANFIPIVACSTAATNYDLTQHDNAVNGGTGFPVTWYNGNPGSGGIQISTPTNVNLNLITDLWAEVNDNGCTNSVSIPVVISASPVALSGSNSPVCAGQPITFSETGGSTNVTWQWAGPGSFSSNQQNPSIPVAALANAGIYSVTVTNSITGCTATSTTTVVVNSAPSLSASNNSPVCTGATLTLSGNGSGTWAWTGPNNFSSSQQNPSIPNVTSAASGTYSVTLTANACAATASTSVSINAAPAMTSIQPMAVSCNGGSDGSINLTISGGTTPYAFVWNPSQGNVEDPLNLAAGDYSVTVTDASACSLTANATVSQPTVLSLSCTQQSPVSTAGGSDGVATLTFSGGVANYEYSWSGPSNGSVPNIPAGTVTIPNLAVGTYTVILTDTNNCDTTCSFSIAAPACGGFTLDGIMAQSVSCNGGSDGSINLTLSGGTTPYTFVWNPSQGNVEDPLNLAAGDYSVTVTDASACSLTANATVSQPTVLSLSCTQQSPVSTAGGSDGVATLTFSGGVANYEYSWSGPSNGSVPNIPAGTVTIPNLAAGTYTITLTDTNNCDTTCSFSISQPGCTAFTANLSGTDTICSGASTDLIFNFTGGTAPYTVNWTNGTLPNVVNGQTVSVTPLSTTTYSIVSATDANACPATSGTSATLSIIDNTPPVAACQTGLTLSIGASQNVQLAASAVNNGSSDNCGGALQFSFSSNTGNVNVVFDCGDLGSNAVELWATDAGGNQASCQATVEVNDNQGFCPTGNCVADDYQSLTIFHTQTNGGGWFNDNGWLGSNPVNTSWNGIVLNSNGCVKELLLSFNNLSGTIPNVTGSLMSLEKLSLAGNQLVGEVPEALSNLGNLVMLTIGKNKLEGTIPKSILELPNLQIFNIDSCNMDSLPPFTNPDLQLWVNNNRLTFDDVLPAVLSQNVPVVYGNQDSIFMDTTLLLVADSTLEIDLGIDEGIAGNVYAWVKDGVPLLPTETDNTLTISGVDASHAGAYWCYVSNPQAPGLVLVSRKVTVIVKNQPSLPNDDCPGVVPLGIAPICPTAIYTNANATESNIGFDNFPPCFVAPYQDVWFSFVADPNGLFSDYRITLTGTGANPVTSPQVALYRGDCAVDELQLLECGAAMANETEVWFDPPALTPGLTYFLRVNSSAADWGDFQLCIEVSPCVITGLSVSAAATDVSCTGDADGTIVLTAIGTGPFLYALNDSPLQPDNTFGNLAPGEYSCTVRDSLFCFDSLLNSVVGEPENLDFTGSATSACEGTNTGSAQVVASGGTSASGNYLYTWQGGATQTGVSGVFGNLLLGTYACTVSDDNDCTVAGNVTVMELPAVLSALDSMLCPGETLTVGGQVFGQGNPSGQVALDNAAFNGCDSVVNVTLSFYSEATFGLMETLCTGGSLSINGTVYDEANPSGTEVIPGGSFHGCDSTIYVNLSFDDVVTANLDTMLCPDKSITVNGTVYNQANPTGSETFPGGSYLGCDSVVNVSLSFYPAAAFDLTETLCTGGSVTVNGTVYDAANPVGTEVIPGGSFHGCDSTVQVNLSFNDVVITALSPTLCPGESVTVNGTVYDEADPSGTETIPGGSYLGCDSVVNVSLSFYPAAEFNLMPTLCPGESLSVNGTTYGESNPVGMEVLHNASIEGCDSTVNVNLSFYSEATFNLSETLCTGGSLIVNGTVYDEVNPSGTEVIPGGSFHGCDSTIYVSLSFDDVVTANLDTMLCPGESLSINGTTFDEAQPTGSETFLNGSYLGCDSIVNVALTFLPQDSCTTPPPPLPEDECISTIPNAFTPDPLDDINYEFDPVTHLEDCLNEVIDRNAAELTILNRWGEAMFRAKPYRAWDGSNGGNSGSKLPQGTYYYFLVAKTGEKAFEVKGAVNLISGN